MAQLMSLPLTISCSSKSRLVLPSRFYLSGAGSPGSLGQNPREPWNGCVCVCVCYLFWCWLTQVVLEKWLLNGCLFYYYYVTAKFIW